MPTLDSTGLTCSTAAAVWLIVPLSFSGVTFVAFVPYQILKKSQQLSPFTFTRKHYMLAVAVPLGVGAVWMTLLILGGKTGQYRNLYCALKSWNNFSISGVMFIMFAASFSSALWFSWQTRLMLRAREQDVVALSACTVSKVNTDITNEPAGEGCRGNSSVWQHQKLARSILLYGALINLAFVIFWGVPLLIGVVQLIGGYVFPIEVEMVSGVLMKLNPIADVVLVVLSTGEGAVCRAVSFSSKPNLALAAGAPAQVAPFPKKPTQPTTVTPSTGSAMHE